MSGFNVNIGANAGQLTRTLGELQADLKGFQSQLKNATNANDVVRLNQAIAQTSQQIKSISGAQNINAIGTALKQLPPGANQAANAINNLSRVAQDAPFGFIGISNNINPLLESFQRLKAETGSGSAALKALAGSLAGAGGLGLAVGIGTALLTLFGDKLFKTTQTVDEAAEALKELRAAQKDAVGEVSREISEVQELKIVLQSEQTTRKEKEEALKRIKAVNSDYFGDLKLEDNLVKNLNISYQKYIETALQRANVASLEKQLDKINDKILEQQLGTQKLNQFNKGALDLQKQLAKETGDQTVVNNILALNKKDQKEQDIKINSLLTDRAVILQQLAASAKEIKVGGDGGADIDALKQRIEALKQLQTEAGLTNKQKVQLVQLEIQLASRDAIKLGFTAKELQQHIDGIIESNFPVKTFEFKISPSLKIDKVSLTEKPDIGKTLGLDKLPENFQGSLSVLENMQQVAASLKEKLNFDQLIEEGQKVKDFLTGQLGPAFTDLFAGIASDGQNALQQFGNAIKEIITKLAAAAITAALFAGIIGIATGGASFGAGAKTFLAGFKSIFSGLGGFKFANGGIATSSIFGNVAETQPEVVTPLSRLPQIINQINLNSNNSGEQRFVIVGGMGELLFQIQKETNRQSRTQ